MLLGGGGGADRYFYSLVSDWCDTILPSERLFSVMAVRGMPDRRLSWAAESNVRQRFASSAKA